MDKIKQILENVVRCKYSEAGVHIKNPIKNSYQDVLGRTTQTLDHVVVVHISI
jgi:signal transduction histidine kinase